MNTLADRLEDDIKYWGANWKVSATVYMVNQEWGHIRVRFPTVCPHDIIESLRDLEAEGYWECSWFRWKWRKWRKSWHDWCCYEQT